MARITRVSLGHGLLRTFRDPAGSLRFEGEQVLREVRADYGPKIIDFLESSEAREWMAQRWLVPTEILERSPDGSLLLRHERIFFPSYPWEWSPGQWIAAAELTLQLCEESLEQGLALKDATPLNIVFSGAHPILVDVLSFEKRDTSSPIWLAYGQFVRTFLLPLLAYKFLGWPLSASLHRRDGYEPMDLYPYLGPMQRWRSPIRSLVTLPHLLEGRISSNAASVRRPPELCQSILRSTLGSLRKSLRLLAPNAQNSRWNNYPETAKHYSAEDNSSKRKFVSTCMQSCRPKYVLDLGANCGVYSRIAAASGANVIALDSDVQASDQNWHTAIEGYPSILPLVVNVARPTPAMGWINSESLSLIDRATGRMDCVVALGLLHHLLIAEQIPLNAILELLSSLTRHWVILEWIPPSDTQFQELCRGRQALYEHLDEAYFRQALTARFNINKRQQLANSRTLWLLEKL